MNREKSHWTNLVKASSARQGVFSEEMKEAVINQIQQKQRGRHPFSYIAIPLLGLLLCLFFLPFIDRELAGGLSSKTASPVDHKIALHYEPAKNLTVIPESDKGIRSATLRLIPLSSVHINNAVTINTLLKYVDYTKPGDDSISYFGFALSNQFNLVNQEFYEIGYGKMSDLMVQESDAFGLSSLRMDGKCGPDRRCVYWLSIDQDKVTAYEQLDASTIYEQDLDGDGRTEVIVLTYASDIYVYKYITGQIQSVRVQDALRAEYGETVTYNPQNKEFWVTSGKVTKRYQYTDEEDQLEQVN
ncbi:hypothetical protein M3194_24075 [Paenibacillus glycanilyticus]|uniref:hypothetical protein n=1 Tax=Paenibacillus glycanilyticus TaxID=126569 RepID=UPI00203E2B19|nr:hypothetical protein [Paenibacillus glycanilyticus]MCM3630415.1 hypothetical protein [Paenibacillus glycanilyticus]